ncbi:cyclic nucleotide-binding protein [Aliiroseovarius zhejiangensis]|uniref:Cyclic nucleotide-binding protein n=1 Tax=Aliiroseovarius zhejiangensis TaxID=1632025 RepID=A0ABQ3IL98_9RHOB|nr:Crp/Fnr family transcriptional regulator [Aliiroseovarius zhejiangensis]GHE87675.1 cyclic nucleotide-binding protein [Aliiroseovarius zhejiangensis]
MVIEALGTQALEVLADKGQRRDFAKGVSIFRHGEPGASLLIVKSGRAEVSITTATGQKSILGLVGPGDVIGDIACLDGGPRSADVVALEPLVGLEVARRDVLQTLKDDGDSAILVIVALCQKARNASEMFELKALASGQSRLASCILRLLNDQNGEAGSDRVKVSQSWLGAYAGLTRENVNRQLKSWEAEGIARFDNGAVLIANLNALRDIAMNEGG